MLSLLGRALLALAFLTTAHQIARPEKAGDAVVRNVTLASQIAPFALLAGAFVLDASSLDLVARFGGDGLPLFYRISAVWGGRAGPLLLWAAILAVVTWFMAREGGPAALEVRIMHGWVLALLVLAWLLEPFAAATGGQGELHPLLQTDLMVIHPPVVFSYYALCLATASVALAGVLRRDSADAIHAAQLHWARAGFVLGSIGIGLGGLWAYTVLDWGGYWAWDPVETGSLLPWLALLLIVHVRARPDSSSAVSASPAIGLLAGALAFHATLVTRANGVWASVHAFVADGEGTLADDPYLRVLDIAELTPVGIEVTSYLVAIIVLGYYAYAHLRRQQWLALAATGRTSMLEAKPTLAAGLVLAYIAVGFWIGSSAVFALGLALILLVVHGDSENPPLHWIALGVLLMLYSAWFWLADITQAVTGMVPFLAPWLLSPEDENEMVAVLLPLEDTSARTRVARTVPWYGGAAFLLLTWLLLTVEIDGSSLEAHELYGAPSHRLAGNRPHTLCMGPLNRCRFRQCSRGSGPVRLNRPRVHVRPVPPPGRSPSDHHQWYHQRRSRAVSADLARLRPPTDSPAGTAYRQQSGAQTQRGRSSSQKQRRAREAARLAPRPPRDPAAAHRARPHHHAGRPLGPLAPRHPRAGPAGRARRLRTGVRRHRTDLRRRRGLRLRRR